MYICTVRAGSGGDEGCQGRYLHYTPAGGIKFCDRLEVFQLRHTIDVFADRTEACTCSTGAVAVAFCGHCTGEFEFCTPVIGSGSPRAQPPGYVPMAIGTIPKTAAEAHDSRNP